MIRMGEQIGGELIVVPHKALLEILVYGVHVDLGKLLVQDKAVEAMYQDIDACGLKGCYPWMLGCAVITVCSPYPIVKALYIRQLGRAASMVSHRKTHLCYKPVLIMSVMGVIASVAIAHGAIETDVAVELIVGIQMCLKGIESFRLIGLVAEGLYMVIADIATQRQTGRDVEILSQAVEHGARELRVKTHIMASHTYNIICGTVSET